MFEVILLFLFMPALMTPIIIYGLYNGKRKLTVTVYSFLLALFFAICGYLFIEPSGNPDLVRYIEMVEKYRFLSLSESFNLCYDNLYVLDIWFWCIAKIGDYQLLPATSVFVFYFIEIYMITDFKIRKNLRNSVYMMGLIMVLFIVNFTAIVTNIRNIMAFSVFLMGIYREYVQEKRNILTYSLYIIPCFIHPSTYMLVFIRICLWLFYKVPKYLFIVVMALPLFLKQIISIFEVLNISPAALTLLKRGEMYFLWDEGGYATQIINSGSAQVFKLYYLFLTVYYFGMLIAIARKRKSGKREESVKLFLILYLLFSITAFQITTPMYLRFVMPFISVGVMIYFEFYMQNKKRRSMWNLLTFVANVSLIVGGIAMNIYRLKGFMDMGDYFFNILGFPYSRLW